MYGSKQAQEQGKWECCRKHGRAYCKPPVAPGLCTSSAFCLESFCSFVHPLMSAPLASSSCSQTDVKTLLLKRRALGYNSPLFAFGCLYWPCIPWGRDCDLASLCSQTTSPVPGMRRMSKNGGRRWTWFDHRSLSWLIGLPKLTWVFRKKLLSGPFYRKDSLGPGKLKDLLGRTSQVSSS